MREDAPRIELLEQLDRLRTVARHEDTPPLELLERASETAAAMRAEVRKRIVGQHEVVDEMLTALLANGHALLVGVPGASERILASQRIFKPTQANKQRRLVSLPNRQLPFSIWCNKYVLLEAGSPRR